MKKLSVALLPLTLILVLAAAGCGKPVGGTQTPSTGGGNVVSMTTDNFVQHSITVHAGDSVEFQDPSDTGGTHILCLGKAQSCVANPQGPAELNTSSGVQFNAGDTKSYKFANPGTYTVTCTIHSNMDVTVTVQ
jgi:plastocyanin